MTDSKNISLLLIPYLTVCGVLFHIAYWDTFGLNGLSFISASDIIKSAVYPISTSLLWIFPWAIGYFFKVKNVELIADGKIFKKEWQENLFFISWVVLTNIVYFINIPYKWQLFPFIASILPVLYLLELNFLKPYFKKEMDRFAFIFLAVFFLLFSYSAGKYQGNLILSNQKYKYIKNISPSLNQSMRTNKDTLKYIGSSGNSSFFTDLKNQAVLIIKESTLDTLILYDSK
jgi:hypothetical protein